MVKPGEMKQQDMISCHRIMLMSKYSLYHIMTHYRLHVKTFYIRHFKTTKSYSEQCCNTPMPCLIQDLLESGVPGYADDEGVLQQALFSATRAFSDLVI